MSMDVVDYDIRGAEMQFVEVELDPGESAVAEAGSMMYMTFAAMFVAQLYGIHLSLAEQITMMLTLMVTSKGIAGVPRASLIIIQGAMAQFHIPEAGLVLILAGLGLQQWQKAPPDG